MNQLPMIIDSFAGGGGASTGIERALGRSPDVAINHNKAALALHAANHPDTLHLDSNIWDVEPRDVVKGRPVGLLWASPDCKHFSKAKGGAPKDRNIRDLAWIVVNWAEHVKPDVILMENVEEFKTWGPLGNEGQPIKEFSGQTFELWIKRLRKAGYKVQWRELRGCDYGAPTIRKRFFMVARRDGRPIVWPKPTHGDPKSKPVMRGKLKPWRTAAECIDWSLPCPSIFDTVAEIKEKHGLRAKRPLAANTLARVARGMKRYVLDAERPFLVNLTDKNFAQHAINRISTIAPSITRFNRGATGQDMRDPLSTITANSWIKRPGGAAPLGIVAPSLVSVAHGDSGGRREYPLTDPYGVVTAGGISHAIVAPTLATFYGHGGGRGKRAADIQAPLRTVTVENRHALIAPHLLSLKGTARRDRSVDAPHPTILAGGYHSAIVAPILTYAQHGGANRSITDPTHTITASRKDQNGMISAFLAQHNKARNGFNPGRPIDAPISTLTHTGSQQTLVTPYMVRHFGNSVGHSADEPIATTTAGGGGKTGVVAPWFAKYYGTGDGARHDEPLHTVTVKDRMGHVQAELAAPEFGPEHEARARAVADFLREHDAWDNQEFVTLTIDGNTFIIVDIGMRMLSPRELFNAQGFPPDYVIEGVWKQTGDDWTFQEFTKSVQVSCCGNSVCPDLAEALASANCSHLIEESEAAYG